ncbi:MAG: TIGR00730 family Rossman fold protein [Alphaproteobacteria bacterium]
MTEIRAICLYCASSRGRKPVFSEAAARFGALLAERGLSLIYGGGHVGLMGVAADAVLAAGGKVVGVIPRFLVDIEVEHRGITDLVVVGSMHERKQKMFELADGFVIFPGGLGTLDEAVEIITWKQLSLHDKPIVLLDLDGYWGMFLKLIEDAVAMGFAKPAVKGLFTVVKTVDEILPALSQGPRDRVRPAPSRI